MEGLHHPRAAVTSLFGIGGVGKTALATWSVIDAFKDNSFDYIVSVTAKDRELTERGTLPTEQRLTTYDELLDTILRVLRFEDALSYPQKEKEDFVTTLLKNEVGNGLLYVDNLETVDDPKILKFLDSLPLGVRAVVTSRIDRVRVAAFPIQVGPLEGDEIHQFIATLVSDPKLGYLSALSNTEKTEFGSYCNGIPLAMRWIAQKCHDYREALNLAQKISSASSTNEELLEFSFRRIFDDLSDTQRLVLKILSIYPRPMPLEEIHICADESYQVVGDVLADMETSSLVEIAYDDTLNSNVYTLLPITRTFVYGDVRKESVFEESIRQRMQNWLDASDVKDPLSRAIARGLRQAQVSNEDRLLQLADDASRRGRWIDAHNLYSEAIKRNPQSWRAHYQYADFLKRNTNETKNTLDHFIKAIACVPHKDKKARARINREYGIFVKKSGSPTGMQDSIQALKVAAELEPENLITIHALADSHHRLGEHTVAIRLLEPIRQRGENLEYVLTTLINCYEATSDPITAALRRRELEELKRSTNSGK